MHSQASLSTAKAGRMTEDRATVRTRPTNNQLLYKAYFRWHHYPVPNSPIYDVNETDACASVTAAFLQVMSVLQEVEAMHCQAQRNVLKILSQDTRHTKVVNLACGTHRVSDELKKHYLTDLEGTQYTTNLDRNRYGADNQYMFTVIRHNLTTLGLCPCLVDVEVLDQKSNETVMVSAGIEACVCEESFRGGKEEKMSVEGRSCSPGSRTHSEEKSSGKSTSFTQTAAPGPGQKPRGPATHAPQGDADGFRTAANNRASLTGTSVCEFNAAVGLASVNRHQQVPASSRKTKRPFVKSGSPINTDSYLDSPPDSKQRFNYSWSQSDFVGGFGKRTRENDGGTLYWPVQSSGPTQKTCDMPTKTSPGVDYKRMKTSFSQLRFDSDRIMDEVIKMKSKLGGMDPLRYQIEEDSERIRRMENELISLKSEMMRFMAESRQVESQLLVNRRVIGMLLNRLQQSLGANPELGSECCLPKTPSPVNSNGDGYDPDSMEPLMSQQNDFQGDSVAGLLSAKEGAALAAPTSMMIALAANNIPSGMNGHGGTYDAEWISTTSSANSGSAPNVVAGQPSNMSHRSLNEEPAVADKRLSALLNSKIDPHSSDGCGFRESQNVFEFNCGSV